MKKISLLLAVIMVVALFAACGKDPTPEVITPAATTAATDPATEPATEATTTEETPVEVDGKTKSEGVMDYATFMAAEAKADVVIEGFVQAKFEYSTAYGNASLYLADDDGAYFVYRWKCTEEEYNAVEIGAKVQVKGVRANYAGEEEVSAPDGGVIEVTVIGTDKKLYDAIDVTAKLGTDDLVKDQNKKATFKGLKVVASKDPDGKDVAWLYSYNGTGSEGSDVYVNFELDGKTYTFLVESDFCGVSTDVYKAIRELQIGDVVDIEGFVYWYNGINTHITAITKK